MLERSHPAGCETSSAWSCLVLRMRSPQIPATASSCMGLVSHTRLPLGLTLAHEFIKDRISLTHTNTHIRMHEYTSMCIVFIHTYAYTLGERISLSLPLALTHTYAHTHTYTLSLLDQSRSFRVCHPTRRVVVFRYHGGRESEALGAGGELLSCAGCRLQCG